MVKSRAFKIPTEKHTVCANQSNRFVAKTCFDYKCTDRSIAKSDNVRVRPPQCCEVVVPPGSKIPLQNRFSVLSTACPTETPIANVSDANRDKL